MLSGAISSGKSTLAKNLEQKFGARIIKTKDILVTILKIKSSDRLALQKEGDRLDKETEGRWVLKELSRVITEHADKSIFVVDSVRTTQQIDQIRKAFGPSSVTHVHIHCSLSQLKQQYKNRNLGKSDALAYDKVKENPTERNIDSLADIADIVINTTHCQERDVLVRAASRMSLYGKNDTGYVDVLVGGQYGSEGKGHIAWYLSKEYDLLVRVGGPNAGHSVYDEPEKYIHHQLPSGTRRCDARLLLGPGMIIDVDKLRKEISECGVDCERLSIDPQAMIINEEDKKAEAELQKDIGSTAQGVGSAATRKIMLRGKDVKLARDIDELKPYIRPAIDVLTDTFAKNGRVLLEGTQGTALSIHHGVYPYVTSRDTTVSGCLSEAGIPISRVRRVVMVCRSFPIRVENPAQSCSGPMSLEIDWKEVSKRSKIPLEKLESAEKTSTTKRRRRVGEFDWDLLRKSALLNGPTDIAFTFADYLTPKNALVRRLDQLAEETIMMIEEIERVSKAKVSLIATGFNARSIIDRREW